jgi:hypothetical protein
VALYWMTFTFTFLSLIFMLVPDDDHEKAEIWNMLWIKNILFGKI